MFVYSRNYLFSLRSRWKFIKYTEPASILSTPISPCVWTRIRLWGLLGKTRGSRGGTARNLSQAYTIPVIEIRRYAVLRKQTIGVNMTKLLNIQTRSYSNVQSTVSQDNDPNRNNKSKLKIAHLNVRSIKNRDHFTQTKIIVQENSYDIFAVSESWLMSTIRNAD